MQKFGTKVAVDVQGTLQGQRLFKDECRTIERPFSLENTYSIEGVVQSDRYLHPTSGVKAGGRI